MECRWSTRMGVRGHGFRGVGTVCYLCRVCNLSIADSTVTTPRSRSHHESTFNKNCTLSDELCIVDGWQKGHRCIWDEMMVMVVIAVRIMSCS